MTRIVALREANQAFSRLVREVQGGEEVVITRNGQPVAMLSPIAGIRVLTVDQEAALERTRLRLEGASVLGIGPLDRNALHER
jgi:prevent-host-death family protein